MAGRDVTTSGARRGLVAGTGVAAFAALARHARRGEVSALETRMFRAVNALPEGVHAPLWLVMQAGSLAGVGVASGVALVSGRRATAIRLGVAGTFVWGFCKLVKRLIGRGRPAAHLDAVVIRGAAQTGLGFPSGHTTVAFTLAGVAAPALSPAARRAAWTTAGLVALSRQYVGAHLPADVAGGVALSAVVVNVVSCTRRG